MAAYITQQDMEAAFSAAEMADLDASGVSLSRARETASRLLDGAASRWYALPLPPLAPEAVGYLCDLARFHLYTRGIPDAVEKRAEVARAWLGKVASGSVRLLGRDGLLLPQAVAQTALPAVGARTLNFGSAFVERYREPTR